MRLVVLTARYGPGAVGGAEGQARAMAEAAVARGWFVEAWTTCAESHISWENTAVAGTSVLNGVTVRRFPVDPWDPNPYRRYHHELIQTGYRDPAVQQRWIESGPRSQALYEYVSAHVRDFDVVATMPYVSAILYPAIELAADRVVWWPCLHNEVYAFLPPIRERIERVWATAFNSPEEAELALGPVGMKLDRHSVIGEGVSIAPLENPPVPNLDNPYILYIGRLEEGKNLPLLYDYTRRYFDDGGRVRLVTIGKGNYAPPDHPAFDHRGYVDEEEKARLLAGALATCQPSLFESFSLVMMESWLAERPSLVHEGCAVTRGHVTRAKGGFYFGTYADFRGALDWLRENPELAARMGRNGRAYVESNFTWPAVLDRFEMAVERWKSGSKPD
jgi:glycosyltransferase involved in cell wall biosynthesis